MSYITIVCPYCNRELFMPEDAKNVVCMYCAKPINVAEIRNQSLQKDKVRRSAFSNEVYELLSSSILSLPEKIIGSVHDYGKFSISNYEKYFPIYKSSLEESLNLINIAYEEDNSIALDYADQLFEVINKQLINIDGAKESSGKMFNAQYFIVTFFIPAILDFNFQCSSTIVDTFVDNWNKKYANSKIKRSTYDEIKEGFRFKNKWCFITTATCQTLDKSDDCYELNMFRKFRDRYSEISDDTKREMLFYYTIAPQIVKSIEERNDRDKIYNGIWKNYLSPCLKFLEDGEDDRCAVVYREMISELMAMIY